ncbi:MAG: hypothetical protein D4R93_03365 [Deltaproteobacteria bacterium]|nr:MAG: hypothetical protein D4R93_03365 [Deltaproteobacteria bacterium]
MQPSSKFVSIIVVILCGLLLSSCGTTKLFVPVTRPAEINLVKFKRIAIGEITGQGGQNITEDLTQALLESNRFEVLDRAHLDKVLGEHNLTTSGFIDEAKASEIGKMLGAAVLVFGRVSVYKTDIKDTYQDWKAKDGNHRTYYRTGVANITANFQLTDLTTGKILTSKKIEGGSTQQLQNTDAKVTEDIDRDALLSVGSKTVVTEFMKKIAPYQENVQVKLFSDSDIPELERGISFAKIGQWDRAIDQFKSAIDSKPNQENIHKAYFDLGVAYEYSYMFKEAMDALNKAFALKAEQTYSDEMGNCRAREQEYRKLQEQTQ